jgi:hypothetical protein
VLQLANFTPSDLFQVGVASFVSPIPVLDKYASTVGIYCGLEAWPTETWVWT